MPLLAIGMALEVSSGDEFWGSLVCQWFEGWPAVPTLVSRCGLCGGSGTCPTESAVMLSDAIRWLLRPPAWVCSSPAHQIPAFPRSLKRSLHFAECWEIRQMRVNSDINDEVDQSSIFSPKCCLHHLLFLESSETSGRALVWQSSRRTLQWFCLGHLVQLEKLGTAG